MKIVDLFAGIGGIRLGFELAAQGQIQCVLTSEWDKWANMTYTANFGAENLVGDIHALASEHVPEHDILLAGFPCQPFSQAGEKKGFVDTRGTLFFEIERILQAKKPKAFLLENVKHLLSHDKGQTFQVILAHLKAIGYHNIHYQVLKARDFGLPQNRERIYIVGFLDDSLHFEFPTPPKTTTRVGNILEQDVPPKYTISDKLWQGHQRRKIANKQNGKGFGFGLVTPETAYTNTMSARYYKDGSEILVAQNGQNPRKLTPREAARLQGFPESYILPTTVSDAQLYKQFGNSVPVSVITAIATSMLLALSGQQSQKPKTLQQSLFLERLTP